MPFQIPVSNHPWRKYKNNYAKEEKKPKEKIKEQIKSVKVLVADLLSNWDNIEIVTFAYGTEGRFKLNDLPQTKIAAWLSGLLKRNYQEQRYDQT